MKLLKYLLPLITLTLFVATCDTPTDPGSDPDEPGNDDPDGFDFSHTRGPGSSAADFLTETNFDKLIVEIQYMEGFRPRDNALDALKDFLEDHLIKSEIHFPDPQQIPSGGQNTYSANDIRDLEAEHRQHYSDESTLASYNIFVDGTYSGNENVLGIAYYNTSNGYFGRKIHEVAGSPPFSPSRYKIEGTVMRHEYGHLFGLVGNGTDMQEDHQENGPHCSEQECVMFHTVNTTNFFANLFDDTIPDFDDFCVADIEGSR